VSRLTQTRYDTSDVVRVATGVLAYKSLPQTLLHSLHASVEGNPEGEAIVEIGGQRLSYLQLWHQAARVAGGLREIGVKPGDRVGIRLGNGTRWCLAFFGCQMAGAIAVPINARLAQAEVDYISADAGVAYVVDGSSALPDAQHFTYDSADPEDVAAIFYTSGTTGSPKGAMTTHANFLANNESLRRVLAIREPGQDRNLVSAPLFHVTGCNSQLLPTLASQGTIVILPTFDVRSLLKTIELERISQMVSVPAIYWYALNQPDFDGFETSSVKSISYGGAPITPALVAAIKRGFPNARVGNGFGLTETASCAAYLPDEYSETRPETVGFPVPVAEVQIDSDSDAELGELLIRAQNVVRGYWRNDTATQAAFQDGWFRSGDIARIDAQGFIQIVDRKKDMINRGGEKVYSIEVENAIAQHEAVLESAVVGVPDPMMGEKVGAVVVVSRRMDPQEIIAHLRGRLADYKIPEFVHIQDEPLRRNTNGKLVKSELRSTTIWGPALRSR